MLYVLPLALVALVVQAPAIDGTAGEYVISLESLDAPAIEVVARLEMTGDRLLMDSIQASHLPDGWGTFVQGLSVVDARGSAVPVERDGPARWRLAHTVAGPVTVRYRVDLGFTREPWPVGNEQAGQSMTDALYIVGRPLFVLSNGTGAYRVRFRLPAGFRVSTPWTAVDGEPGVFLARDATSLVRNPIVIGRHEEVRFRRGPFDFTLALPGEAGRSRERVSAALDGVLDEYLAMLPGTTPGRYVMVYFYAAADDGEGFADGAAFTTTDEVAEENRLVWANFLAHELMHYWNGMRVQGRGPRASWQWFSEGVTEYMANLALVRAGVIDEAAFLEKVERHLGNYLYFGSSPAFPRIGLEEAGTQKGTYRFGVYDGGWTVAFCLDTQMRLSTDGRVGMEHLLARLYDERIAYDLETLADLIDDMSGVDAADFLRHHVAGAEAMPVGRCAEAAGYSGGFKSYAGEAYLEPVAHLSPEQQVVRRALLRSRVRE